MSPARLCALIMLFVPSSPIRAQSPIGRGTWLVGGTATFHSEKDIGNNNRFFVIDINPRLGYFILPHLALNANLQFVRVGYELGHNYEWGVGPGLTYYFGRPNYHVFPYLTARTLFSWATSYPSDATVSRARTWNDSWLVGAGAVVMIAKNVGFTGELFYQHDHFGVEINRRQSSNSSEEYGLRVGLAVFVF